MIPAREAIEKAKAEYARIKSETARLGFARDAVISHFEDEGWVLSGWSKAGRAPTCSESQIQMSKDGQVVLILTGYDSNGPRDVWDYLKIYNLVPDRQVFIDGCRWSC